MQHTINRFVTSFLLIAALGLTAFRFSNVDDFISQLVERFNQYAVLQPVEKVYLHTDRDVYLTGETIWLKGYVFNGNIHTADTISRVVYVELIDAETRHIKARLQLKSTNSYAPGQLMVGDSLAAGGYVLRAYTNYMRNFSEAFFFSKPITIVGGQNTDLIGQNKRGLDSRMDVQFLPEGGQLVAGLDTRVAFKGVGTSGKSVPVSGFVLDAQKDTVVGFASTHLGMGLFTIKPEAGQNYTAYVQQPNGTYISYAFPVIQAKGAIMQVDNLSDKERIRVYIRHADIAGIEGEAMTLFAHTRGQVIQVVKVPVSKRGTVVQLSRNEFPEGISHLTLFDQTNKPVSERLIFIDKQEQLRVAIRTDKSVYKNRQVVTLSIKTTQADGKPVPANLSLAALDERLLPKADSNQTTIVSHMLLTSDLAGVVEQPGYYFNPANKDRLVKLDLLLMTQGWRRFVWSDVLTGKNVPTQYPVETGLSLTGRVLRPNQKPVGSPVKLTFVLTKRDSTRDFLTGDTDEMGYFGAYGLTFTDTTTVFIQGLRGRANRDLIISLDQLLSPTVTITHIPYNPVDFRADELTDFIRRTRDEQEIERQIRRNREVLLQSVTVKAKKYQERDSRVIYGSPDASVKFDAMNTAGRLTVLDVIQGRVAGVQVMGSGLNASVQIRGAANFSGPIEPLFVLDGVPIDKQAALSISIQDVDKVDVLKGASAAIYGARGGGGVISILTKRGSPDFDFSKEDAPGSLIAKLAGYTPVREFYIPNYSAPKPEHTQPDFRTTVYWNPLIQTDGDGNATLSFPTSDAKTSLRIDVEGATTSGLIGVGHQLIRVE